MYRRSGGGKKDRETGLKKEFFIIFKLLKTHTFRPLYIFLFPEILTSEVMCRHKEVNHSPRTFFNETLEIKK